MATIQCDNPEPPGPSKLVDDVLALLENAGVPTPVNDKVVRLIENWEGVRYTPYADRDRHPDGHTGPCACRACRLECVPVVWCDLCGLPMGDESGVHHNACVIREDFLSQQPTGARPCRPSF